MFANIFVISEMINQKRVCVFDEQANQVKQNTNLFKLFD